MSLEYRITLLPGDGVADWARIAERMRRAPRLMSVQSEAGKGPAMADIKAYLNFASPAASGSFPSIRSRKILSISSPEAGAYIT